MWRAGRLALAMMTTVLVLTGCGDRRLTMDNYERLSTGMTRAEVEAILGDPSECSGVVLFDNCRWGSNERFIQAQFVDGEVMAYQYRGLK